VIEGRESLTGPVEGRTRREAAVTTVGGAVSTEDGDNVDVPVLSSVLLVLPRVGEETARGEMGAGARGR